MIIATLLLMISSANSTDCAPPQEWSRTPVIIKTSKCTCDCPSCEGCSKTKPKEISPEAFREHRMLDKYGQVWTHSNKTYLEKFIKNRNATPIYSNCPTGTCPARR